MLWVALCSPPVAFCAAVVLVPASRASEFGDISLETFSSICITTYTGIFAVLLLQKADREDERTHRLLDEALRALETRVLEARDASLRFVEHPSDQQFAVITRSLHDVGLDFTLLADLWPETSSVPDSLRMAHRNFRAAASCDVRRDAVSSMRVELVSRINASFRSYRRSILRQKSDLLCR